MRGKKVTEGEGYVSGDYECWCIQDVPFEEWKKRRQNWDWENDGLPPDDIYPSDFLPISDWLGKPGFDYTKKIRYKVTVEIEHIEGSQLGE